MPLRRTGSRLGIRAQRRSRARTILFMEEIDALKRRVAVLNKEVKALRDSIQQDVIVLRTISREQAKQDIQELFRSRETLFYSDIARHLRLELPLVVELCQELKQEGDIEVDADVI